jgi:hypothetical protein
MNIRITHLVHKFISKNSFETKLRLQIILMLTLSSWLLVELWTDAPYGDPFPISYFVEFITICRVNHYRHVYSCVVHR